MFSWRLLYIKNVHFVWGHVKCFWLKDCLREELHKHHISAATQITDKRPAVRYFFRSYCVSVLGLWFIAIICVVDHYWTQSIAKWRDIPYVARLAGSHAFCMMTSLHGSSLMTVSPHDDIIPISFWLLSCEHPQLTSERLQRDTRSFPSIYLVMGHNSSDIPEGQRWRNWKVLSIIPWFSESSQSSEEVWGGM